MDFPTVLDKHLSAGTLSRINDSTFGVTSATHNASATVRVLQGRATVEFGSAELPEKVPSSLRLREEAKRFRGAFYASADQLDEFLREMV